jgi:hypothetical protein
MRLRRHSGRQCIAPVNAYAERASGPAATDGGVESDLRIAALTAYAAYKDARRRRGRGVTRGRLAGDVHGVRARACAEAKHPHNQTINVC